jgi:flagellar basal body-associated protein FliL
LEARGKVFTIILLVIIAILALSLVGLVGYILVTNNSNSNGADSVSMAGAIAIPSDDELSSKMLYGEPVLLNLKSENNKSSTPPVIKLNIELLYFKKVKGVDVENKLTIYDKRIKELVNTYFQNMTLEEAKDPETKKKARNDLIESINKMLIENEGTKRPIIYNIVFDEWFYT